MNPLSRSLLMLCVCLSVASSGWGQSGTAQLRRSPTINGTIDGSVRLVTAESVTLNSSASVTGDLFLLSVLPGWLSARGHEIVGGTPMARWLHSDMREVAYLYTHLLFDQIVTISEGTP